MTEPQAKASSRSRPQSVFPPAGIEPEQVREQLQRILSAKSFQRSQRLSRFLEYAVEEALAGRASQIKEYAIGVEVFERPPDYDTRVDPIVRVEAGRLRSKIREYYDTAGKDDRLWLGLRKRGYRPRAEWRENAVRNPGTASPSPPARPKAGTNRKQPKAESSAIAVLPFADLSPQQNQEFFCDALTQQLIAGLSKAGGLHVVGRSSSFQFKHQAGDVRSIARELNVGSVVEGAVQRVGSRIRVTVQLVSAANGLDLWGDIYDHDLEDIFQVQDEVTAAVVEGVRSRLLPANSMAGGARPPALDAYNQFLKGLYHWNQRTAEELQAALDCFERSVRDDPGYAPAYAGLASCYVVMGLSASMPAAEIIPKAEEAVEKALRLQPESAKALAARGLLQGLYRRQWEAARDSFEKAIALHPQFAAAHQWFAIGYWLPRGGLDRAQEELLEAQRLNPPSVSINDHLGLVRYMRREWKESIAQLELALELNPDFYRSWWNLGRAHLQAGNRAEALAAFEKADRLTKKTYRPGGLCHAYARAGEQRKARRLLAQLKKSAGKPAVPAYELAEACWGLEQSEAALQALEKAAAEDSPWIGWINVEPIFDGLRGSSRFESLLRRIGLAE